MARSAGYHVFSVIATIVIAICGYGLTKTQNLLNANLLFLVINLLAALMFILDTATGWQVLSLIILFINALISGFMLIRFTQHPPSDLILFLTSLNLAATITGLAYNFIINVLDETEKEKPTPKTTASAKTSSATNYYTESGTTTTDNKGYTLAECKIGKDNSGRTVVESPSGDRHVFGPPDPPAPSKMSTAEVVFRMAEQIKKDLK